MSGTVAHARAEQLRCAEWIAKHGWDERGAVLGMGDWMAEEVLMEMEMREQDDDLRRVVATWVG